MIDNIFDIKDMTRLYQLYIMFDKILMMQSLSKSGINYEVLKKFKNISMHIDSLNLQNISREIEKMNSVTKDFYDEQEKLSKVVKVLKDTIDARNMLSSKYRNYSVLPLVFENVTELDNFDYYHEKLDNLNEYIKNDIYLSKLNETLSTLGISLGNENGEEDQLLVLIPVYEEKLKSAMTNSTPIREGLKKYGFDLDSLLENNKLELKYEQISQTYQDVFDKYEAMKIVNSDNYSDIVTDITNEFKSIKRDKNIIEIIKLVLNTDNDYDAFLKKRILLKTYLLDIGGIVFNKEFCDLVDYQYSDIVKISDIKNKISKIQDEIHRNNALILRIKEEQIELNKKILKDKSEYGKKYLNNQVVSMVDSYISYSKEKVYNVLKFVLNKLNRSLEKIADKDIFEDVSDNLFGDTSDYKSDDFRDLSNDAFINSGYINSQLDGFNQNVYKIESYDDVFHNEQLPDESITLYNISNKDLFDNSIFDNKMNSEIFDSNNFWPSVD